MKAGSVLKHVISAAGQLISILNVSSRAPASSEAYILVNTGVYAGVNRCMVRQNKRYRRSSLHLCQLPVQYLAVTSGVVLSNVHVRHYLMWPHFGVCVARSVCTLDTTGGA